MAAAVWAAIFLFGVRRDAIDEWRGTFLRQKRQRQKREGRKAGGSERKDPPLLNYAEQHCYVVADAAADYEDVPDGVGVGNFFGGVEDYAEAVESAAGQ